MAGKGVQGDGDIISKGSRKIPAGESFMGKFYDGRYINYEVGFIN
jgi:hypothetical protein